MANAQWVGTAVSRVEEGKGEEGLVLVVLVERTFLQSCLRWPLAVARDLGRCLRTKSEVRPGHVEKKPALMACVQVQVTGLKQVHWR